jgi:3-oxoacyl-[acyl-carrier-protein] synthase II
LDVLGRTDLVVSAGSGERDTTVDCKILETSGALGNSGLRANEILPSALRPTLFLAQLSNLLAGNISIVQHVTGSSRTFIGEEMAGLSAIENAFRRVSAGQSNVCLVGGALNAERHDLLLGYELGHNLWKSRYKRIEERASNGGGLVPGSVGAFLVIERREHAEARGVHPYARLRAVETDSARRKFDGAANPLAEVFGRVQNLLTGPAAIFSGVSGVAPATAAELAFFDNAKSREHVDYTWAYGNLLGHCVEAHFPAGIALAALAMRAGGVSPALVDEDSAAKTLCCVDRVLVTTVGHWRGEGLALLEQMV